MERKRLSSNDAAPAPAAPGRIVQIVFRIAGISLQVANVFPEAGPDRPERMPFIGAPASSAGGRSRPGRRRTGDRDGTGEPAPGQKLSSGSWWHE